MKPEVKISEKQYYSLFFIIRGYYEKFTNNLFCNVSSSLTTGLQAFYNFVLSIYNFLRSMLSQILTRTTIKQFYSAS